MAVNKASAFDTKSTVKRHNSSLYVTIPSDTCKRLGIFENDQISFVIHEIVKSDNSVIELVSIRGD